MTDAAEAGDRPLSWLELESMIPLDTSKPGVTTVKTITTLSSDSIKRNYSQYVVRMSPKREAMKMRHALKIAAGEATPAHDTDTAT
jgi:hypothetical protein